MASLVLKLGERELTHLPITEAHTVLGRDASCDLVIDNAAISRHHARIEYHGGHFVLHDTSSNGVYLGRTPVRWHRLRDRDEIQIGKFTVLFLTTGGVPPERLRARLDAAAPHSNEATTTLDAGYMTELRDRMEARRIESDLTRRRARARKLRRRIILGLLVATGIGLLVWTQL